MKKQIIAKLDVIQMGDILDRMEQVLEKDAFPIFSLYISELNEIQGSHGVARFMKTVFA